ncbi:DUF5957 family protein [Streptomyces sp. NPDC002851]
MKYALAVLGGLVGGFVAGELVAVAIGVTAHAAFGADMPFVLKLMPLYLALAGAVAVPLFVARSARARGPASRPYDPNNPYGDAR